MLLINLQTIKQKFPLWNEYFTGDSADTDLTSVVEDSESELSFYISVDTDSITAFIKLCLMNIIRKRSFDRLHGDKEFEKEPQIIRDYKKTISILEGIKDGSISLTGETTSELNSITLQTERKKFNSWFNKSNRSIEI